MNLQLFRKPSVWIALALFVGVAVGAPVTYHKLLRWKKFRVVEQDILYRSGSLRPWQLRKAIDRYDIKTVYSLTHTRHLEEQEVCDEKGVKRYFCYLPGDGVGSDDPYLRFLEVIEDPRNHPVLVHCSAGVQRTGGAVALYRILFNGWEADAAIEEMIDLGNKGRQTQIEQIKRIAERLRTSRLVHQDDSPERETY
ncbi:Tyrosine phosphatase family protein [Planctomycetes bacterium Pan216]|uniref:Tyrosine phosphatase family protein n=1 Tax=Kolteria novifilia TaxID=2527975 RepID=A0A518B3W3_9BACT|nr:Tyrosine phosphatase family protein [Planctomycetes bacterium Pan216]